MTAIFDDFKCAAKAHFSMALFFESFAQVYKFCKNKNWQKKSDFQKSDLKVK